MLPKLERGISRRQWLASAGLAAAAAWMNTRGAFAEPAAGGDGVVQMMRKGAASAKIEVQKLRGNLSALIGSGGNIAVLQGKEGKLLVDAGITGSRPQITEALAGISADPVKLLVNTHWHFDHTDGNEWLHAGGATLVAHENVRKRLSASTRVEDWDFTFPPSPAGALPVMTCSKELMIHLNGEDVAIEYYGPCHTDGDLCIHFTKADVFHTGDTWWNGHYPFIDYSTGGSIGGMIRATEVNLKKVSSKTIIIPGHGPVGDKTQLTEYHDMLVALRNKIGSLKKQGKSVDEVIAAHPSKDYDAKWGGFVITPEHFVRLVHAGV